MLPQCKYIVKINNTTGDYRNIDIQKTSFLLQSATHLLKMLTCFYFYFRKKTGKTNNRKAKSKNHFPISLFKILQKFQFQKILFSTACGKQCQQQNTQNQSRKRTTCWKHKNWSFCDFWPSNWNLSKRLSPKDWDFKN